MEQWTSNMGSPEVPVNQNFAALAWASVYGKRSPATSGLNWGYYGGEWSTFAAIADGVLSLTDDDDNYIVVDRSTGAISVSVSATNWNDTANYARVYLVTTVDGLVTTVLDRRGGIYGVHGPVDTTALAVITAIPVACGDESTPITTGVKVTFRMPFHMMLTKIKGSLTTPQDSGSVLTVDVSAGGVSLFTTLMTFDNDEDTTATATTPSVLDGSPPFVADDTLIEVEVTQVGDGTAAGLKIYLVGVAEV
jgi:hypothetical protein